ncbi:MAG: hypothetical protein RH946_18600 [Rhodospirillales bacterium]
MNQTETPSCFIDWHQLFDAICIENGYEDNSTLANELCVHAGTHDEAAYGAAVKNLSNWRRGQHLPNRRNFGALTTILKIDSDPERLAEWNRLYNIAKETPKAIESTPSPVDQSKSMPGLLRSPVVGAAVAALILVAGYGVYQSIAQDPPHSLPPEMIISQDPIDMTGKQIYWREITELKVGDFAVIHAARGKCGEQPPSWPETVEKLPELPLGVWLDGGVGYRVSRSCGGATPARAVVFKATVPGSVNFMLYMDPITISVK